MFQVSLALLALAAVAGLTMAIMHFRGVSPPRTVIATLHGLFAAAGLIVLLLTLIEAGFAGRPGIAFGLLAAAALGGFVLLGSHVQGKRLPSGLVVGHGALAVAGFVTLLLAQYALMT